MPVMSVCEILTTPGYPMEEMVKMFTSRVKNDECPICLSELSGRGFYLFCQQHAGCYECVYDYCVQAKTDRCPICRVASSLSSVKIAYRDVLDIECEDVDVDFAKICDYLSMVTAKDSASANSRCAFEELREILTSTEVTWKDLWRAKDVQMGIDADDFVGYAELRQYLQGIRMDTQALVSFKEGERHLQPFPFLR